MAPATARQSAANWEGPALGRVQPATESAVYVNTFEEIILTPQKVLS